MHLQPVVAASAQAMRTTSATCPTPDITDSAVLSSNCARRYATETPNADAARRSPGDAEHALKTMNAIVQKRNSAATCDCVAELPLDWRPTWTEDAVSS